MIFAANARCTSASSNSATNGLTEVLDQACAAAGFTPRAAIRAEQTPAALLLAAAAGLGPTLVPANIVPPGFDGVALLPDPPVRRVLTAYTRIRPEPMAAALTSLLADRVRLGTPTPPG